jgi:hypothetical protein
MVPISKKRNRKSYTKQSLARRKAQIDYMKYLPELGASP